MSDPMGFRRQDKVVVIATGETAVVTDVHAQVSPPIWCDNGMGYFPEELTTGCRGVKQARVRICRDCGEPFFDDEGRAYKYEPSIWLCDECHDLRMEESEEERPE